MKVLLTGGLGYIGSHAAVALLNKGYEVVILDNLANSSMVVLERIYLITKKTPVFVRGDIRDDLILQKLFAKYSFSSVMHFAGLKSVAESVNDPLAYFSNNVAGTVSLCRAMASAKVYRLVFSSSATVYGAAKQMPVTENTPTGIPQNPYGRSKLMIEEMLKDLASSEPMWSIALLRYFNPVGAHASGLIGEDPLGIPNNLLPYILQVAIGRLPQLTVFGDDYPTIDGTGVRDYIHVVDLVNGHLAALKEIEQASIGAKVWNLGTGKATSVYDMIHAFERISGKKVPFVVKSRRLGDVAECWANVERAQKELKWVASIDLEQMLSDSWRWQIKNPMGYSD